MNTVLAQKVVGAALVQQELAGGALQCTVLKRMAALREGPGSAAGAALVWPLAEQWWSHLAGPHFQ